MMRRLVLLALAVAGCRNFSTDLQKCIDEGRCNGGGAGGGGAGMDPDLVVRAFSYGFDDSYNPTTRLPTATVPREVRAIGVWVDRETSPRYITGGVAPCLSDGGAGPWVEPDAGLGTLTGCYRIPGVPAGEQLVELRTDRHEYTETSARVLELGVYAPGRLDAGRAVADVTYLANVTGLNAWGRLDQVQVACLGAGAGWQLVLPGELEDGGQVPLLGEIAWTGEATWAKGTPLVDGTKGDKATVFQLGTRTNDAGQQYSTVVKSTTLSGFTLQQDGGFLDAGLGVVPGTPQPFGVHADVDGFSAALQGVTASAQPALLLPRDVQFLVDPAPLGAARGLAGGLPDILLTDFTFADGGPSWSDGGVDFVAAAASPFSSQWEKLVYVGIEQGVRLATPYMRTDGTPVRTNMATFVRTLEDARLYAADGGALRYATPRVLAPSEVLLNGDNLISPLANVPLTPVFSWTPRRNTGSPLCAGVSCEGSTYCDPSSGACVAGALCTRLSVVRVDAPADDNSPAPQVPVATLVTQQGAQPLEVFQVPPEVLCPGSHYFAVLTLYECSEGPLDAPNLSVAGGVVRAVTNLFTTAGAAPDGGCPL